MQKTKKNKKILGMSMVSVMIASAIMGGLGLVMMQYVETASKNSKYTRALSELEVLHNSFLSLLKNPASCQASFKGKEIGKEYAEGSYNEVAGQMVWVGKKVLARIIHDKDGKELIDPQWEANSKGAKIKLVKIKIYSPISPIAPPPKAPKPEKTPTDNGWVTTVAFFYEMYKPAPGAKETMMGSSDQVRYVSMVFNNFKFLTLAKGRSNCSGEFYYYRDAETYSNSGICVNNNGDLKATCGNTDSTTEYGVCYDTSLSKNPIITCTL